MPFIYPPKAPSAAQDTLTPYRIPHFDIRVREKAKLGIMVWLRQSTLLQVESHEHSGVYQRKFGEAVASCFDLPRSMVREYCGLGESGRPARPKPEFHRMLRDMSQGKAGLLVFADGHRAVRSGEDGELLIRIAREQGVIFVTNGLVLDPDSNNDLIVLRTLFATAEFQSASSEDYSELTRLTAARNLRNLYPMPSPLVWADPGDPRFIDAMTRAGAPDLVATWASTSRLEVRHAGSRRIPLPYPSREVLLSLELRFRWLWETDSTRAVYERIVAGIDGWPVAGHVPSCSQVLWTPDMPITWKKASHEGVSRWFCRPGLYGIYCFYHKHFLSSPLKKKRKSRLKGLHHHRKIAQVTDPLPSAEHLIRSCSDAQGAIDATH